MELIKFSVICRKIHRISLWGISISGLIQMVTGLAQKFPQTFSFMDMTTVIMIHTTNSVIFAFFFITSLLTGWIMYATPWLIKHFRK